MRSKRSMLSMRGGFIFRNRGPLQKVSFDRVKWMRKQQRPPRIHADSHAIKQQYQPSSRQKPSYTV
jgi:hypothetical protein